MSVKRVVTLVRAQLSLSLPAASRQHDEFHASLARPVCNALGCRVGGILHIHTHRHVNSATLGETFCVAEISDASSRSSNPPPPVGDAFFSASDSASTRRRSFVSARARQGGELRRSL